MCIMVLQDVAFHPEDRLLACGTLAGDIVLYAGYGHNGGGLSGSDNDGEHTKISLQGNSHGVVRALDFTEQGRTLCAGTTKGDLCVIDIERDAHVRTLPASAGNDGSNDGGEALHRVMGIEDETVGSSLVCTGDDGGIVALWDIRDSSTTNKATSTIHHHTEYVSDMVFVPHKNALLTVSGDGTLCMVDVRMNGPSPKLKLKHRSEEDADDELLSVCIVRQGQKIVCGTTSGVLHIYSWGYWNDCSDRFPGHPESVTGIVAFDDETVLTGSSDGLIRVLNIQPNTMLGVLGEHSDFDIERLVLSKRKEYLASISHDHVLKLWNTSLLLDDSDGSEDVVVLEKEEEQGQESDTDSADDSPRKGKRRKDASQKKNKGAHKIPKKTSEQQQNNFFADLL